MNQNFLIKIKSITILIYILINYKINVSIIRFKIFISSELETNKLWVGEEHSIIIKKYPENSEEKIYFKSLNNITELLPNLKLLMKYQWKRMPYCLYNKKGNKRDIMF